ncbi:MAG: hypothetical protein U1E51_25535, partial [Candidatus Binatia bacterium]|nr:hypothetical protein [Candidatus Binatia bacterium]
KMKKKAALSNWQKKLRLHMEWLLGSRLSDQLFRVWLILRLSLTLPRRRQPMRSPMKLKVIYKGFR